MTVEHRPRRARQLVGRRPESVTATSRSTAAREEAERLKGTADPGRTEAVLRDIRARHAGERLDVAVAEGAMTREEADDLLERVRGGEHSRQLRSHLGRFRLRRLP